MKLQKPVVCTTFLALALAANLPAAIISGTFTINGGVTVTANDMSWISNTAVIDEATIAALGLSGNFIGMGGNTVTIQDLHRASEPVGTTFPEQLFIGFPTRPTFPNLNITFLELGAFTSTDCFAAPLPGQTCTLDNTIVPGGSPFMFANSGVGTTVTGSTASWHVSGVTSDHQGTWTGTFTAQFDSRPYQSILNDFFNPTGPGAVSNSFSAALTVVTPEPGTTILLGGGLILLSLCFRRFQRS